MNYEEALNWDEYKQQKANAELGDAIILSFREALTEENISKYLQLLGEKMGVFISQQGYRPSDQARVIIKIPGPLTTADPTNRYSTISGLTECELSATKDQYILYASKIIDCLKRECKYQIEKSWEERLEEHLIDSVAEASGLSVAELDEFDRDEIPRSDQMKKLQVKIEEIVQEFVASLRS